uniref:Uncharacterized protein n=1 Tax=Emiliania huxleyi (strain CCMP1516) TaxID=280463 RepID=A0A0D3JU26_EMIH1
MHCRGEAEWRCAVAAVPPRWVRVGRRAVCGSPARREPRLDWRPLLPAACRAALRCRCRRRRWACERRRVRRPRLPPPLAADARRLYGVPPLRPVAPRCALARPWCPLRAAVAAGSRLCLPRRALLPRHRSRLARNPPLCRARDRCAPPSRGRASLQRAFAAALSGRASARPRCRRRREGALRGRVAGGGRRRGREGGTAAHKGHGQSFHRVSGRAGVEPCQSSLLTI